MSDTARSNPSAVQLRIPRRAAATLAVAVLPLSLAACGLFGGGTNKGQAPVVIPSESAGPSSSPSGSSASSTSSSAAAVVPTTVTKTGIVVHNQTLVRTATKTLPQVTRVVTPAPITLTQTQTQTQTNTVISVPPAQTVTKTATKTATKTVTKTVTKKA
jgi:hypothetical protein